ncbi:MAG TPA: O-antigen ligase family protein [Gaiellaceae bacterium]|nr:O-antigen ligase family protein [Gaiellaceae bacterium]
MGATTTATAVVVGLAAAVSPAAGLGLVGAVGGALVVARRPAVGGILLLGVVPAASGLRRGLPVPGLRLSEIAVAGIAAVVLMVAGRNGRAPWRALDWAALAYVVLAAAVGSYSLLRRDSGFDQESVGTMISPLEFFLLYRAIAVSLVTPESRRRALRAVVWASTPVAALALLQRASAPGVASLLRTLTGVDPSTDYSYSLLHRATGPFPHWQMLGAYLMVVILICVALLLDPGTRVLRRPFLAGILALDAAALTETVSMTPIVATLVGTIVLAVWYGRTRRLLPWLALACVVGAAVFGSLLSQRAQLQYATAPGQSNGVVPQTLAYRVDVWRTQFLPALTGRWLTGWGPCCSTPDSLPAGLAWDFTESVYLTLLLRGGVILLGAYAVLMWAFASTSRRAARARERPAVDRAAANVLLFLVLALVPLQWIEPYFIDDGLPQLLWGLAGLLMAAGVSTARPQTGRSAA